MFMFLFFLKLSISHVLPSNKKRIKDKTSPGEKYSIIELLSHIIINESKHNM